MSFPVALLVRSTVANASVRPCFRTWAVMSTSSPILAAFTYLQNKSTFVLYEADLERSTFSSPESSHVNSYVTGSSTANSFTVYGDELFNVDRVAGLTLCSCPRWPPALPSPCTWWPWWIWHRPEWLSTRRAASLPGWCAPPPPAFHTPPCLEWQTRRPPGRGGGHTWLPVNSAPVWRPGRATERCRDAHGHRNKC